MNPISKSLILKNKAISSALLIMYSLIIALLVTTSCVAPSFDKTINSFFDEYKVFDILITTKGTQTSLCEDIENIKGVKEVSGKITADKGTVFENGKTLLTRIMSVDSNKEWKIYDVINKNEVDISDNMVMVSAYFAKCNEIDVGSTVSIYNGNDKVDLKVTNIISSPETIGVGSYIGSWYDMRDFGFIYVSSDLIEKVFGVNDVCNVYKALIDKNVDTDKVIKDIKNIIGEDNIVEISKYEESNIKTQLDYSIDTVKSITLYLPAIVIVIGILFSLLFIYQVTRKSRKDIALLRAIGYSKRKIQSIFNVYILSISVFSSILGSLLGLYILRFIINIYKEFYYLPGISLDGNIIKTALIIAFVNILAVLTCILACRSISKIEPALAFGDNEITDNSDLPESISKLKCNPFTKLSLTLIYRNKTRVFVVTLCMLACMILTMLSISVIINKSVALNYTFTKRYDYNLAIFCSDYKDLQNITKQDFVKDYSYGIQNDYIFEDEVMRIEAHPKYDNMDGIILENGFARRHSLKTGDYITINDVDIEVVDIVDEYLCSTQYVSFDTAKKFGFDSPNAIEVYLKNDTDLNKALSYASKLDSFLLNVDINSIKLCAEDTMAKIDMPCYIIIGFSGIIGFIIMYNMAIISFDKRRKEFSTLRALGTSNRKIIGLLLKEAFSELFVALILAPISFPLISKILTLISSSSEEYVFIMPLITLGISFVFTFVYTLIGVYMTYLSIKKMDIALELNS